MTQCAAAQLAAGLVARVDDHGSSRFSTLASASSSPARSAARRRAAQVMTRTGAHRGELVGVHHPEHLLDALRPATTVTTANVVPSFESSTEGWPFVVGIR